MIPMHQVQSQLRNIGFNANVRARQEISLLPKILMPGEIIEKVITGTYVSFVSLFVATNKRLLVVDKKFGSLIVEDIPYDMIGEVQYKQTPFKCQMTIYTGSKNLQLNSYHKAKTIAFCEYLEKRMLEERALMMNGGHSRTWAQDHKEPLHRYQ